MQFCCGLFWCVCIKHLWWTQWFSRSKLIWYPYISFPRKTHVDQIRYLAYGPSEHSPQVVLSEWLKMHYGHKMNGKEELRYLRTRICICKLHTLANTFSCMIWMNQQRSHCIEKGIGERWFFYFYASRVVHLCNMSGPTLIHRWCTLEEHMDEEVNTHWWKAACKEYATRNV